MSGTRILEVCRSREMSADMFNDANPPLACVNCC